MGEGGDLESEDMFWKERERIDNWRSSLKSWSSFQ